MSMFAQAPCRQWLLRTLLPVLWVLLAGPPSEAQPAAGHSAAGRRTALRCGTLIDGRSDTPIAGATILVEGSTIVRIGGLAEVVGADTEVIDLSGATCLPGLIDAHAHILIKTEDYQVDHLRRSSAYKALRGQAVARQMLEAGWTTIRILGDADVHYAHLDLRRAIDEGLTVGPRITGAGHYLSITGGGGDINFLGPEHQVVADGLVVDGVAAIRQAVRKEVKYGSDWIKVLASGAMMSAGDNPDLAHFSPEELQVLVEEATRLGVPVAAHAHSAEGIRQAVLAGARSIEHGTFLEPDGIGLLVENDVWLVPTLFVMEPGNINEEPTEKDRQLAARLEAFRTERFEILAQAHEAGVKIGVGTDYVGFEITDGALEFSLLVEAGLTPMEAIQAGTSVNAELLGWEDRVGTIAPGRLADIIAVPGDPLNDLTALQRVSFVMLDGAVVRSD